MNLCRDTTINSLMFTALTLLYKDKCNSASTPNVLIIFSATETFECFLFFYNTLLYCKYCQNVPDIYRNTKDGYDGARSGHRITILVGTYEQFVTTLCNAF